MPIDPLSNLRDVILPADPGFWPPAFGWWLLLVAIIVVLIGAVVLARALYLRIRARTPVDEFDALVKLQPHQAITQLSILMRRVAIANYSRPAVAGLCGEAWLKFLDQSGNTDQFTNGVGRVLTSGPYTATPPEHLEPLFKLCRDWIKTVAQ